MGNVKLEVLSYGEDDLMEVCTSLEGVDDTHIFIILAFDVLVFDGRQLLHSVKGLSSKSLARPRTDSYRNASV